MIHYMTVIPHLLCNFFTLIVHLDHQFTFSNFYVMFCYANVFMFCLLLPGVDFYIKLGLHVQPQLGIVQPQHQFVQPQLQN